MLIACDNTAKIYQVSGAIMGTTYHISVVANQPLRTSLSDELHQKLLHIDQLMSTYKTESEINQLNKLTVGTAQKISAEMIDVIRISQQVFDYTGGAFDPTVGALVDLWGFGPIDTSDSVPEVQHIAKLRAKIGFDKFHLDNDQLLKLGEVKLDFSAVAKGYAVDVVSNYLLAQGYDNHLVEVGGELRLRGLKPHGKKWHVGIEAPQANHSIAQQVIAVSNVAVATSGDYRNYFERNGKRYSHTIDPRTGYPVTHQLASVTVIADNAAMADALATGFAVMGDVQALRLAEQLALPVYMLVKDNDGFTALYSSAFAPYLH